MIRPSFKRGSILKQNMLESLRDYPYSAVELMYLNYGDGVISGFDIEIAEEREIIVSPGIIKINGRVYLSTENLHIEQKEEVHYVYVILSETETPDGRDFTIELTQSSAENEHGVELFRYTKNARLFKFQSIQDVVNLPTNRINVINQRRSINGGSTLAQGCFELYAKEILNSDNASMKDISFAYQCLNGINNIALIEQYFNGAKTNEQIVSEMKVRLSSLKKNKITHKVESAKKEKQGTINVS